MLSDVAMDCRVSYFAACAVATALATGCSRLPDSAYTLRTEAEKIELPAKHSAQIAEYLAAFHGTPANPRMALPTADADLEVVKTGGIAALPRTDKPGYDRLHLQHGRAVYAAQCAGCHGTTGDGKGPAGAYLNPPPRDYRNGIFKFTSTPRGSKPRRDDLRRILKYGAKGTSMPAFRFLSDEDAEAVLDYVQVLATRGQLEIDLINRLADLVPPPRKHRHRYHGVFAPNHKLRPAVTALAIGNIGKRREAVTGGHAAGLRATGGCCDANPNQKPRSHDTSRIAWAKLMARVGEEFPLACPTCGGDIRLR